MTEQTKTCMTNTFSELTILTSDALEVLKTLPEGSVQCCVTSPPYFALRSYMPDWIVLKDDVPDWVIQELETIGVKPYETK